MTLNDIEDLIDYEQYYLFPDSTTTVCRLVLVNGYVVVGDSSPTNPDDFNEYTGRIKARNNARNKIWPLQSYALRTK